MDKVIYVQLRTRCATVDNNGYLRKGSDRKKLNIGSDVHKHPHAQARTKCTFVFVYVFHISHRYHTATY